MATWIDLVGLKIVAIRKLRNKSRASKASPLVYYEFPDLVFFDDGKTFIRFEEQDYYDYHDADSSARNMDIRQDKGLYDSYMDEKTSMEYKL